MTFDPKALEAALIAFDEINPIQARSGQNLTAYRLEAAILAYFAQVQETVGEDELRPASQKLASILALKHGFILPEVADYDEMTKAILTAARRKG